MKTQRMKTLSLYFPITRIDEEKRIVEGHAFVNEVVDGEGGIRLKRTAMEAATPDYMKWGTIRAMHQPSAAGTALPNDPKLAAECGVHWDEKGAYLRSYISDDDDWKKVKDGTYKGYSVGVAPKVMRGKNVESCVWIETSLVDRPKDPDALLTQYRADEVPAEVDVEIQRQSFAEYLGDYGPSDIRDLALDYLWFSLLDITWSDMDPAEKEAAIRATCEEFTLFMIGAIATGKMPPLMAVDVENAAVAPLARIAELTAANEESVQRAVLFEANLQAHEQTISTLTIERDEKANELSRVQESLTAEVERARVAEEEVTRLKAIPLREPPARRAFTAEERAFTTTGEGTPEEKKKLEDELQELSRSKPSTDPKEQDARAGRISQIRRLLRDYED